MGKTSPSFKILIPAFFGVVAIIVTVFTFWYVQVQTAVNKTSQAYVFNPEIPVNEYWDFGSINNLKLYVNNTDRNVIYALDNKTGKIVWTIWGKEYGFAGYEIRLVQDKLFITMATSDGLKNRWHTLWVFDEQGKLLWKQAFSGYLDMPQMEVTHTKYVILQNRSSAECDTGCGAACTKKTTETCREDNLWAFDLNTGKIIWRNNTRNYYGVTMDVNDDDTISAHSGGVGMGRFAFDYLLDGKTGVIKKYQAVVNDTEFSPARKQLVYNPEERAISLHEPFSDKALWTLPETSVLYKLVTKHLDGSVEIVVLNEGILCQETISGTKKAIYFFDKKDGKLLWRKEYDVYLSIRHVPDVNGVLVFTAYFTSTCANVCSYCTMTTLCTGSDIDMNTDYINDECRICRADEKKQGDYVSAEIWAFDDKTGHQLWRYKNGLISLVDVNKDTGIVHAVSYGSERAKDVQIELDLRTGKEIKK